MARRPRATRPSKCKASVSRHPRNCNFDRERLALTHLEPSLELLQQLVSSSISTAAQSVELCIFTFLQLPHLFLFDTWRERLWPQSLFTAFLSLLFSFLLLHSFPQYFNILLSLSQLSLPHCGLIRQHSPSLSCDIALLQTSGLCGSQMYYSMMWRIIEI